MELTTFVSDLTLVTLTTLALLAPRALETYLALREQKDATHAEE